MFGGSFDRMDLSNLSPTTAVFLWFSSDLVILLRVNVGLRVNDKDILSLMANVKPTVNLKSV